MINSFLTIQQTLRMRVESTFDFHAAHKPISGWRSPMRLTLAKFTLLGCTCAVSLFAQLTVDQRIADFQQLVGLYVKNYGPYEWKRDALKFDLFKTAPWIDRIKAAKDDLDFYEVMVDYVASLNDAHDTYTLSSTFVASL